jgi:hypothetical protein
MKLIILFLTLASYTYGNQEETIEYKDVNFRSWFIEYDELLQLETLHRQPREGHLYEVFYYIHSTECPCKSSEFKENEKTKNFLNW